MKRPVVGGAKRKRFFSSSDDDEDAGTSTYAATPTAVTPAKTTPAKSTPVVPPRHDLEELRTWNSLLPPPANGLAVSKDTIINQKDILIQELLSELRILKAK